jgi:hypothetical protein
LHSEFFYRENYCFFVGDLGLSYSARKGETFFLAFSAEEEFFFFSAENVRESSPFLHFCRGIFLCKKQNTCDFYEKKARFFELKNVST